MTTRRKYKNYLPGIGSGTAVTFLIVLLVYGSGLWNTAVAAPAEPLGLNILIDSIHAHNYLEDGIRPGNHNYHSLFGFRDAITYLRAQGHGITILNDGKLNPATLENVDTLFINLVSDNLPPFLVGEIAAIKAFVEAGGNLLVITDHSNAYHHSYKLMPLFEQLGIRIYTESALETKPHTLGPGPGWIVIDNFRDHPVTRNLHAISFHSGGTVDANGGVAFLSDNGWGDVWNTSDYGENSLQDGNRGNYGNFKLDEGERTGALAVVMAREIGRGKVVVVGDQNMLGNLWLRFGDNYKLLLNIFAWFAGGPASVDYASFPASERPRILLLDDLSNSRFADYDPSGLYNLYSALSRYYDTYIHDRIDHTYDLLLISPSVKALSTDQVEAIRTHLARGRSVIVMADAEGKQLLDRVAPASPIRSTTSTETGSQQLYASGAKIQYQYDFERFTNANIAEPTRMPTAENRVAELALLRLVRSLLSSRAAENAND